MSRTRSRSVPTGTSLLQKVKSQSGVYVNSTSYNPTTFTGALYGPTPYSVYERMTDELSPPGSKWDTNYCYHLKVMPSIIRNSRFMRFSDSRIDPTVAEESGLCFAVSADAFSGLHTPPWADLVNELSESVNGCVNDGFLMAVPLVEAAKTIRMIRNPFRLLTADWRKIARNLSASSLAKGAANVWLESSYGWKSCYYDVKGAANAYGQVVGITNDLTSDLLYDRISVSSKETLPSGTFVYPNECTAATWANYNEECRGSFHLDNSNDKLRARILSLTRTARVGCRQEIDIAQRWDRTRRVLHALGLDLSSMVDTLWELVPFSFVVDWFVDPLGAWKLPSSYARLHRADISQLHYSYKDVIDFKAYYAAHWHMYWKYGTPWIYQDADPWELCSGKLDSSPGRTVRYRRWHGLPDWSAFTSSLIGKGLSLNQGLSGLSLLIQRLLN